MPAAARRPKPLLILLFVLAVSVAILLCDGPAADLHLRHGRAVGPARARRRARCWPTGTAPATSSTASSSTPCCTGCSGRCRSSGALLVALVVEAAWEIVENTPMVIDRYREATIALGYTGDSILNSASDIAMMAVGFLAARRLPVWASVALVAAARTGPADRHPRQSDAQRLDAACAERRDPRLAGGLEAGASASASAPSKKADRVPALIDLPLGDCSAASMSMRRSLLTNRGSARRRSQLAIADPHRGRRFLAYACRPADEQLAVAAQVIRRPVFIRPAAHRGPHRCRPDQSSRRAPTAAAPLFAAGAGRRRRPSERAAWERAGST